MEPGCSLLYSQKPDLVSTFIQMNPFHTLLPYCFKIHFYIKLIHIPKLYKLFLPFRFSGKNLYAFLFSPVHCICVANVMLVDFNTQIICGENFKLLSSSLHNFLHPPVTLSLSLTLKLRLIWRKFNLEACAGTQNCGRSIILSRGA